MTREELIRIAGEVGAYRYANRYLKYEPTHTFTVEKLEAFAELVAAKYKQDALRYRWLREQHDEGEGVWFVSGAPSVEKLDDAIDAAMEKRNDYRMD